MGALVSHIGGYGIPAIPTQPATAMFSHKFHRFHRFTQIFTPQNSRNTEQTGREYYPTYFTDLHRYLLPQNSRNSQNRLAKNIIPQISQIYTDIYSHRIHGIHRTDWQRIFSHRFYRFTQIFTPTEFTEFTEQTGREYYPTYFTDLHRWLGCVVGSHRIHRIHRSLLLRRNSHRFHGFTQM